MRYATYARRNDPFALMRSLLRDFDSTLPDRSTRPVFPAINLWQKDDAVIVTAELPGIDPADIDISTRDNILTLSGERKPSVFPENARWHRNERSYGRFTRSIRLPFAVSEDRVDARMKNGVLHILVTRPEEDRPRKIEIKAE